MNASMDIRILVRVIVLQRISYFQRLLRRRCIVQVDQLFAANTAPATRGSRAEYASTSNGIVVVAFSLTHSSHFTRFATACSTRSPT